jgi:4-diphosphocytidyl-2-C-methyl-D-erythritol kinase
VTELITITAPAKINLSLRILGKRPDGFHELETLMAPIQLADTLEISHGVGKGVTLICNDPELTTGEDNLCIKAAWAFRVSTGLDHGVSITLLKKIPHGAGLGGGSSDAAAVLKGLNELFDHPLVHEELEQLAESLGSDVPFFLGNGPAWCRGRGEIIEHLKDDEVLPGRALLLIKPAFPVPTAWAYKQYAQMKESGKLPVEPEKQFLGGLEIVNDLEAPVFHKYLLLPVMKTWLRQQPGVESAFMTGSGSSIVAVLVPKTASEEIADLKQGILAEFGETMWVCETGWGMGDRE